MLGRATMAILFLALVWGNMVAGLKAGLACPDWPLCHGKIVPPFRWDIYMEFIHRLIAGTAALFLLVLSARRHKAYRGTARLVPVLSLLLLALEIGMGAAVVLLEIPVQLTTFHFMIGVLLFLLAFYMASFDGETEFPSFSFRGNSALFLSIAVLVYFQAALGAYVRHLGAGTACPDFPRCLGQWLPSLHDPAVAAHSSHRLVGILVLMTAVAVNLQSFRGSPRRENRGFTAWFLVLMVVQIAVGAVVVLSGLQFLAAAVHLSLALLILWVLGRLWVDAVRKERATLQLPP